MKSLFYLKTIKMVKYKVCHDKTTIISEPLKPEEFGSKKLILLTFMGRLSSCKFIESIQARLRATMSLNLEADFTK